MGHVELLMVSNELVSAVGDDHFAAEEVSFISRFQEHGDRNTSPPRHKGDRSVRLRRRLLFDAAFMRHGALGWWDSVDRGG